MAKKKGRPKIVIDWDELDKLCEMQCTLDEIADWFKCSTDTIQNKCKSEQKMVFSTYFKKKSVGGRISLRRKQFKVATEGKGNVPLLIFLGKQYLGQTDGPKTNETPDNIDWKSVGKTFAKVASKIATTAPVGFDVEKE